MGIGALVFGSGAMSVNAAFNSSVNPTGDIRVVVDEELVVEAGSMFRSGGDPNNSFDTPKTYNGVNLYDNGDFNNNSLFGGTSDDGLENIGAGDVPAATARDQENGDLYLETAVDLDADGQIGDSSNGFIQVRNDTEESQDIAIRYSSFGDDVGSGITETQVTDTFILRAENDKAISPSDPSGSPQTVYNTVTVDPGSIEQVYVDYDTATHSDSIVDAADNGDPFGGSVDTVDFLDELEVGVEEDGSSDVN